MLHDATGRIIACALYVLIAICVVFSVVTELSFYLTLPQGNAWLPDGGVNRWIFYLSFFTILSNIALAVGGLIWVCWPQSTSFALKVLRLDGLIGVMITGVVYNLVIRALHQPPTVLMLLANECLHVVVPLLGGIAWISSRQGQMRINGRVLVYALVAPIAYIVYILIRGAVTGLYPYPFLNVIALGYGQVLRNIFLVTLVFLVFAAGLWFMEKLLATAE